MKLLFTVAEACEALALTRTALYEEMAAGRLDFAKVGKRRLIHTDDLKAFAERLKHSPAA